MCRRSGLCSPAPEYATPATRNTRRAASWRTRRGSNATTPTAGARRGGPSWARRAPSRPGTGHPSPIGRPTPGPGRSSGPRPWAQEERPPLPHHDDGHQGVVEAAQFTVRVPRHRVAPVTVEVEPHAAEGPRNGPRPRRGPRPAPGAGRHRCGGTSGRGGGRRPHGRTSDGGRPSSRPPPSVRTAVVGAGEEPADTSTQDVASSATRSKGSAVGPGLPAAGTVVRRLPCIMGATLSNVCSLWVPRRFPPRRRPELGSVPVRTPRGAGTRNPCPREAHDDARPSHACDRRRRTAAQPRRPRRRGHGAHGHDGRGAPPRRGRCRRRPGRGRRGGGHRPPDLVALPRPRPPGGRRRRRHRRAHLVPGHGRQHPRPAAQPPGRRRSAAASDRSGPAVRRRGAGAPAPT